MKIKLEFSFVSKPKKKPIKSPAKAPEKCTNIRSHLMRVSEII